MEEEIEDKLCESLTEANDKFLELIALLEIMSDIQETDSTGCTLMRLTQKLVKKAFDKTCYCKKILDLI